MSESGASSTDSDPKGPSKPEQSYPLQTEAAPVVTHHQVGNIKYTATVGMLPLKDEFGETEAGIFYTAYQRLGEDGQPLSGRSRPLMFSFNGGPGSASVWLHLGALGPKRVKMEPDGNMPEPPFELVDNPETWLEHTDLVFIDPVGTGWSRPAKKDGGKKFWGLKGDIESVGEFIRLFLARNKRWDSPLYLVGESYGTTRAAGLSAHLMDQGIALSGIVLVSSILNFQTARFNKGNDLPYIVFLPTYAATAWFHQRAGQGQTLEAFLKDVEKFTDEEYVHALHLGASLSADKRQDAIAKLARFTGLSETYIDGCDLRINIHEFCKELLRDSKRTVGRLDSRFKGIDRNPVASEPEHDPAMTLLMAPYTTMINQYLRADLGYETDVPYYVFNPGELWGNWTYGDAGNGHPDTSESLRAAMSKNPHLKVLITSGYYDLATPYFGTEYTVNHLELDPTLRGNITTEYYPAGHMMYIDEACLHKFQADVARFLTAKKR